MANKYDFGDLVCVTGTFTDPFHPSAPELDPTEVYCSVRDPSKLVTTYKYGVGAVIVRSSEGVYYVNIDADEAGVWHYRWWSTGAGQAAEESSFRVDPAKAISAS